MYNYTNIVFRLGLKKNCLIVPTIKILLLNTVRISAMKFHLGSIYKNE